jgi:hypothetical protein
MINIEKALGGLTWAISFISKKMPVESLSKKDVKKFVELQDVLEKAKQELYEAITTSGTNNHLSNNEDSVFAQNTIAPKTTVENTTVVSNNPGKVTQVKVGGGFYTNKK